MRISVRELLEFEAHRQPINAVRYSPDGKYLATCRHDKMVKLWDASTGRPRFTFTGH